MREVSPTSPVELSLLLLKFRTQFTCRMPVVRVGVTYPREQVLFIVIMFVVDVQTRGSTYGTPLFVVWGLGWGLVINVFVHLGEEG